MKAMKDRPIWVYALVVVVCVLSIIAGALIGSVLRCIAGALIGSVLR